MTLGTAAGSRRRTVAATADLITNGGFASGASWNGVGISNMTVSGGKANYAATPAFNGLNQTVAPTNSKFYELTYTISGFSSGSMRTILSGGSGGGVGATRSANGTYVERLASGTGNTTFTLQTLATTTLSIDDVSLIGPYTTSTVGGA